MEKSAGGKKVIAYFAIIFFLTLIILFFMLEFRFIKKMMHEYDDSVQQIVINEINTIMHEMQFHTENAANYFAGVGREESRFLFTEIAAQDNRVSDIFWLDSKGYVIDSLKSAQGYRYADTAYRQSQTGQPYVYSLVNNEKINKLVVAAAVKEDTQFQEYLLVVYDINEIKNKLLLNYGTDKLKVAVMDRQGYPLVWPFESAVRPSFTAERDTFKSRDIQYTVSQTMLANYPFQVFFFNKDNNFATYRIITIMFLIFTLYFLIYQFIVELLHTNNINSYFENIDFNIFNNLQEGIIIANKFNKIVFANNVAHEIFVEKKIYFKKTDLKEIIGLNDLDTKITLKKSHDLLELISSPIFKHGKLLGSLVVISPSREKEILCGNALDKIVELLEDGVIFVDKDNKVVAFNMMASCYLGNMQHEQSIGEVNSELATLIDHNIDSTALVRAHLTFCDVLCELKPVYGDNGLYTGTVVFLKNKKK